MLKISTLHALRVLRDHGVSSLQDVFRAAVMAKITYVRSSAIVHDLVFSYDAASDTNTALTMCRRLLDCSMQLVRHRLSEF